jgi:hypothetical protein
MQAGDLKSMENRMNAYVRQGEVNMPFLLILAMNIQVGGRTNAEEVMTVASYNREQEKISRRWQRECYCTSRA